MLHWNQDGLPPEVCPRTQGGDPRMAVLSVVRLEYHQISLTKLPNMTVESRSRIGRSQSGRRPGGNVCLPQKPKRREVRAKTRLTPRPPSLTERLAWIHWSSERSELVMRWIACLSKASNFSRDGWDTDGEYRSICRTFGALKDALKSISASCEAMELTVCSELALELLLLLYYSVTSNVSVCVYTSRIHRKSTTFHKIYWSSDNKEVW